MTLVFACPQCGSKLEVLATAVGQAAKCAKCHCTVQVPALEETAPPGAGEEQPDPLEANPFASPVTTDGTAHETNADVEPLEVTTGMRRALAQTRPWLLFLAITWFLATGFGVAAGVFMIALGFFSAPRQDPKRMIAVVGVLFTIMGLLCFIGSYFLFVFNHHLGKFRHRGDAQSLERALVAQKSLWRYAAIVLLIELALYAAAVVMMAVVGSAINA